MPQNRKSKDTGDKKPAKRAAVKDLTVPESRSNKVGGGFPLVRLRAPGAIEVNEVISKKPN